MNEHQLISIVDAVRNQILAVEKQLEDIRGVVSALVEKSAVDAGERDQMLKALEYVPPEEEKVAPRPQYERSIQQLLDESQHMDDRQRKDPSPDS